MNTEQIPGRSGGLHIPTPWLALILLDLCLVGIAWAQHSVVSGQITEPSAEQTATDQAETESLVSLDAAEGADARAIRFEAIDIFVDPLTAPLSAWQLELQGRSADIQIVGIEGGEPEAFREPPFYDPKAMQQNRVILAAFSTDEGLPTGKTRVARVHVQIRGNRSVTFEGRLTLAATEDGTRIPAVIRIQPARA